MENDVSIKVIIWNEGRHEKLHPDVAGVDPSGIHGAIATGLKNEGFAIRDTSRKGILCTLVRREIGREQG
jgi:trehalose utilization protein